MTTAQGHPAGAPPDPEDTLNFAALQGIKPMVEVLPLEKAADGYVRTLANQAAFPGRAHDKRDTLMTHTTPINDHVRTQQPCPYN